MEGNDSIETIFHYLPIIRGYYQESIDIHLFECYTNCLTIKIGASYKYIQCVGISDTLNVFRKHIKQSKMASPIL